MCSQIAVLFLVFSFSLYLHTDDLMFPEASDQAVKN